IGSLVNLGLDCIVDLVRVLFQELTGLVSSVLRVVAGLLLFTTLLVLFSVCFCILNHAVDLFLGKTGTVLDLDGVFLAGALVLSGNGNDTVCVNVEGDLNLRHTARSRSDTAELKGTEQLVGRSHLALTLEDLNLYGRLVIFRGREGFRLLGWNGGVALNQLGHHATLGFNTKRQWGDIQEQNVLNFTAQNASLKCCTHCNDLVWVNTFVWLVAGQLFNQLGNSWHTGGTTNKNNVVNVAHGHLSVLDDLVEWALGAVQQVLGNALELGTRQGLIQEQRVLVAINSDVRQVDICLL